MFGNRVLHPNLPLFLPKTEGEERRNTGTHTLHAAAKVAYLSRVLLEEGGARGLGRLVADRAPRSRIVNRAVCVLSSRCGVLVFLKFSRDAKGNVEPVSSDGRRLSPVGVNPLPEQ